MTTEDASPIRPLSHSPTRQVVCPYCGVGCRVQATVEDNRVTKITAHDDSRPNFGKLCPKGAYLTRVLDTSDRLAYPHLRLERDWKFSRVNWDVAATYVASRLQEIVDRHGPNAVAFYGSGQLDTEACYLSGKLFKGYLGTNNTDSNSRLCMSSAVAGYQLSLGSDGPPTCYDDINYADLFFILGANMAENHPVLFQFIRQRRQKSPNMRIIVVDPRRTKTAEQAHVHVKLQPGSDVAFLNGVAKVLLERGQVARGFVERHTNGFGDFESFLRALDLNEQAAICGLPVGRIEEVAQLIGQSAGFLSFYAMGANQSTVGTFKNNSIINLHLLTGQIGRTGAGPFSLTGQPNAMGGRESGYLSHQLPGYRFVANAEHRQQMEKVWRLPPGSIASKPGLAAVDMFDALDRGSASLTTGGDVKAIWIAGTNPAASMPNLNVVQRALRKAELVIVQDCYHPTETSKFAHVLLPAAQWAEKSGTTTNSERLVTRSQQLVEPPIESRPDWWIFARVAQAMGFPNFKYASHEDVWDEYRAATRGTICDQWGITNARLKQSPLQWPCKHRFHRGTERRYTNLRFATPNGRANFFARPHQPPAEPTSDEFPLALTTGRIGPQWHTMTRTGKVPELVRMCPEPFVEIHPEDAKVHAIADGDTVILRSRRGEARAQARVVSSIKRGTLFTTFHWNDMYAPDVAVNDVLHSAVDPISKEPELKHCAVQIKKTTAST